MAPPPQRIGVVGGGVAGLACARRLSDLGKDVVVFDTGKWAPGGRASSRKWADGYGPVDHAAQFASATTPEFRQLLADLEKEGSVRPFRGRLGRLVASPGESPAFSPLDDGVQRFHGSEGMGSLVGSLARGLDVRQDVWVPPSGGICKLSDGSWEVCAPRAPFCIRAVRGDTVDARPHDLPLAHAPL